MSMTKKERAEFDAAIYRAEKLAALRWTGPVDRDVRPPEGADTAFGWDFNSYSGTVFEAWTRAVSHGAMYEGRPIGGTQGGRRLFSAKGLAIAALRHAVEHEAAEKLLAIDRMAGA